MDINLPTELEELVRKMVESGYRDESAVVRDALRLLGEQETQREARIKALQEVLIEGLSEADRGELRDGPTVLHEARAALARRRMGY